MPLPRIILILFLVLVMPQLLHAAPSPENNADTQSSLVERLMRILSNKNIPRIDIPPPPAPPNAPPDVPENMLLPDKNHPAPVTSPVANIEIAPSFLPIYSFNAEDEEAPPVLPFFSSSPVNVVHRGIVTLVVFIHDQNREAARAFAFARSAQDEASARHPEWQADASFIFAPQFLNSEDITSHSKSWPDGGASILRWVNQSWIYGFDSVSSDSKGIWQNKSGAKYNMSSFTVLDFALLLLARPKLFPDLQKVVIAGTGAGADFVQRYAALGIAPSVLGDEGIDVRFALAQTRSFMYLDNQRLVPHKDDPLTAKIESDAFAPTKAEACKPMNEYPYGLDNLPSYGRKNAVNELRVNYTARRIIYLAGAGATLPIQETTPEACALMAQGENIAKRSAIFFASLKRLYGDEAQRLQKLYLVEGINEDGLALWRSACGSSALFGDGACNTQDVGGKAMQIIR